ncbi:DsbA family protein [Candidatus Anaplasma sp. TIGMIC]|nr:DsbA family protein [Candidatus Anaplasma sp. TIGMIC]
MAFLRFVLGVFPAVAVCAVCVMGPLAVKANEGGESITDSVAIEVTAEQLVGLLPDDRFLGREDAPVVIVEYASFSCAHCADFATKVFPRLKSVYVDTGKVLYIYRDFPLDRLSLRAAMLGMCYKDNKSFFSYVKAVFSSFDTLIATYKDLGLLVNIAKISNISDDEFKRCTTDDALMDRIVQQKFHAVNKLDVNATPVFFINGKRYESAHNFDSISEEIEREMVLKLAGQ